MRLAYIPRMPDPIPSRGVLSRPTGWADRPSDLDWLAANIPCQAACPVKTDIPGYLEAISRGDFAEAYRINLRDNVFPGVLGRVCSRPCEPPCRHGWSGLGEPVAICLSKRAAADFFPPPRPVLLEPWFPPTGRRVAVVGAGPAGLAAARDLRLFGHDVVVLERHRAPGGLLRLGIPPFRLPRELVEREVRQIAELGVEIRCGVEVDRAETIEELSREHDAVIVAAGAHRPRTPRIPGADLPGVEAGLSFLIGVHELGQRTVGRRVVVVGGGFTALDCARVALRLGAKSVQIAYRRGLENIRVTPGEKEETEREGIPFLLHVSPVAVLGQDRATAIRLARTGPERSANDPADIEVECDQVLMATGQEPDTSWLPRPLPPNVLPAGDFAEASSNLIEAIADGRRAAAEVDARLMGGPRIAEGAWIAEGRAQPRTRAMDRIPRHAMPKRPLKGRRLDAEVETGFDRGTAAQEARRCYLCHYKYEIDMSRCIYCDQCLEVKPRPSCIVKVPRIERTADGRIVPWTDRGEPTVAPNAPIHSYWIHQADCIRCNACLEVCPTNCISVQRVTWTRAPAGAHNGPPGV